ncbi:hypothetical protein GOBAR_AA36082 [Gossypium barbadense]|uniref:Uncharacterized protein n=1 Tax=Gossypium barbadense TaxID=3634 RepID=A0A2P5W0M4_GOSBA|nr:hypothetical protein GOBAR_AA36082 [Gossypium barbadense]
MGVLESNRFESGGGHSGSRRGSLGRAQRCQHMKPPHELNERVVVVGMVGPRAMKGHHQECPRRGVEEPEVSRQSSHVAANGDDPFRCDSVWYLRDGGRTDALEWLGLSEAAPGAKVCQHFEGEKCMWRVRACSSFFSLNSSVYKPSAAPNSGTLSWRTNPPRFAHGPKHAHAHGCVPVENLYSRAPAELGVPYLDRIEWKDTKYRKRDFFIFGLSGVLGLCVRHSSSSSICNLRSSGTGPLLLLENESCASFKLISCKVGCTILSVLGEWVKRSPSIPDVLLELRA